VTAGVTVLGVGRVNRWPERWGVMDEDMVGPWPCEGLLDRPYTTLWRGTGVEAPAGVVFRWVCQMKVAPYSYDWLDNRGRRSPRTLTPGAEELDVGQEALVFEITDFETDVHITGRSTPKATRLFGPFAGTYRVRSVDDDRCRLVVRLDVGGTGLWGGLRRRLLAWGDLVMMRKQVLTFKALAEQQVQATA
jgi:hypothetical protein